MSAGVENDEKCLSVGESAEAEREMKVKDLIPPSERRRRGLVAFLLFLLGVFAETKVYFYGCIALSELVVFALAPLFLLSHYSRMRREGFLPFVLMMGGLMVNMLISSAWNHTPFTYVVKLFAVFYGILAYYICFYELLRRNLKGLGWFFLGAAISSVITIYAFNPQAVVSESGFGYIGEADTYDVVHGPLFWISRLNSFGQIPIMGAYLQTPLSYSILAPFAFVSFSLISTVSGRSAALATLLGAVIILVGRKRRQTMRKISRHFLSFIFIGLIGLVIFKALYSYTASTGMLGEEARSKYEKQTSRGSGMLKLLMSGRKEFFMAIPAALHRPIMGYGPRAEDTGGYAEQFLLKYGDETDIRMYNAARLQALRTGWKMQIPTHSHIMAAWVWCGLFGLIFFLWWLYLIYQHMRYYIAAIPQWYGYFALTIPSLLWHFFFSPFGSRWSLGLLAACLFFARAVGRGNMRLPPDMELEAERYDM